MRDCSTIADSGEEGKRECSFGVDSEANTDVCTEASEEPAALSDSSSAIGDGGSTIEDSDVSPQSIASGDFGSLSPPPPLVAPSRRTPLSSKAASWKPPCALAVKESSPVWRVGAPNSPKQLQKWKDAAEELVAKMSCAVSALGCVSRVDVHRDGEGWRAVIRSSSAGMSQLEHIQTVAKQSLVENGGKCSCMFVLGDRCAPFQATPTGFCASLGSMRASKKACWDVYNKGVCSRGSECCWEHPFYVCTLNVMIDCTDCATF